MSGFNQHPEVFWMLIILAIIGAVGGAIAVMVFVVGLVWTRVAEKKARRGFEVKLITGETPVLLKEDNHG